MAIVHRTPQQIESFLRQHRHRMDYPAWTYGDEPNTWHKDWDSSAFRFCMFSVADYIQFAANQTVPLLYEMANEADEDILGARAFFPATRKEYGYFLKNGIPIFGVEHKEPLGHFDMFGMSSSYAGFYFNLVQGMKLSGIPVRWRDRVDRKEDYPLVMMGGMGSYVPTPYDPIVDLVFIGEAEDEAGNPGFMALLRDLREYKSDGAFERGHPDRWEEMLHDLCKRYTFLYRPAFYSPKYHPVTWHEKIWDRKYEDLPKFPRKRFAVNLDETFHLKKKPVPWYDTGMGLGELEISRGCQASCLFCAEGYRYRPYRERSVEYLVPAFKEAVAYQGATHAFPAAFEFSGYTRKKELVARLLAEVSDEVDTQSQRVDNFARDPNFGMTMAALGDMKNLTIAIEGNSQRMRDVISKGCTEKEIMQVFDIAFRSGYDRVKSFIISDLPGETPEDTWEIYELAKKVVDLKNSYGKSTKIIFSWTPLFCEGWTPFQYAPASVLTRNETMGLVVNAISKLGVACSLGHKTSNSNYIWNQMFAMADRRAAEVMLDTAIEIGEPFYSNMPRSVAEILRRRMDVASLTFESYFREKSLDTVFPWDFMHIGVGKAALARYWEKAKKYLEDSKPLPGGHLIAKCDMDCITCGACAGDLPEILQSGRSMDGQVDIGRAKIIDQKSIAQRVLFRVRLDPYKRFVGTDHWKMAIRRAAFINDLPITKRHVIFQSDVNKLRDWTAGVDYVEVAWTKRIWSKATATDLMLKLNRELRGFEFLDWKDVPLSASRKANEAGTSLWEIEIDREDVKDIVSDWNSRSYWPVIVKEDSYREGVRNVEYNAYDFVSQLWVIREGATLKLRMLMSGKVSPYDMHRALFGSKHEESYRYPAVKIEGFLPETTDSYDSLRDECESCGKPIPHNIFDQPFFAQEGKELCPYCSDVDLGRVIAHAEKNKEKVLV